MFLTWDVGLVVCITVTVNGHLSMPEIGKKLFDTLVGPAFLQRMLRLQVTALGSAKRPHAVVIPDYPNWKSLDDYINM